MKVTWVPNGFLPLAIPRKKLHGRRRGLRPLGERLSTSVQKEVRAEKMERRKLEKALSKIKSRKGTKT